MFNVSKKILKLIIAFMVIAFIGTTITLDWEALNSGGFSWNLISGSVTSLFLLILFSVDLVQRNKKKIDLE